jgi:predicted DsbA family dithiol-disulfide isomerase
MAEELVVAVWSDVVCPWCYIGKRRLEAALARFAHADSVAVSWHAFELDPAAPPVHPPQCEAERLAKKYGVSAAQAQAMVERVVKLAAAEGLAFDFERIRPGNSFDAHRLLKLAKQRGLEGALLERLMRGYFCEGQAIGDHDTLLRLAGEVGLEVDEAAALLSDDLYEREVRADQDFARAHAIQAVPFFVFGERYAVAGAQSVEVLLGALTQAFQEREEGELAVAAGERCEGPGPGS